MLTINNLSLRIAGRLLLDHASLSLPAGVKAGLVGRNGTGKTTLFKAITGEFPSETGSIDLPRNTRIGQVAQEAPGTEDALIEIVLSALLAPSRPHLLHFECADTVDVAGSSGELLSAMSNLVSNAIRYTPAGGQIAVAWRLSGDRRGEFSVRDSGPGIAPEHLPRLTERFYRVDRSRSRETGGTGLGLAIVKHVAQRHGGELRIDSTPGTGSTFTIVLPASRIRPTLPKPAVAGEPSAAAATPG